MNFILSAVQERSIQTKSRDAPLRSEQFRQAPREEAALGASAGP